MVRRELHEGWTVSGQGDVTVPAGVPGCVHLDLLAAGLIPDPYLDLNEAAVAWVGRADWTYETTFGWDPDDAGQRIDLVAEGLDTVARVELNGVLLGLTRNMHRTHRFDVTGVLRPGTTGSSWPSAPRSRRPRRSWGSART